MTSSVTPSSVAPGGTYTYTVTIIDHQASAPAPTFTITPTGFATSPFGPGSQPTSAPSGASCTYAASSRGMTCTGPFLHEGETQTYTFTLTAPQTPGDYGFDAALRGSDGVAPYPGDSNSGNDQTHATLHVVRSDLGISSLITPQTVTLGEHYAYTVKVKNNGPGPVSGPQFLVSPPGLDFTTMPAGTEPSSAPAGASCAPAFTGAGNTTVCTGPTIAAGDTQTYTFTLTAPSDPRDITITARLGNGQLIPPYTDPDSSNDTTSATIHVVRSDLGITSLITPQTVAVGEHYTYTVKIKNNGPGPVAGPQFIATPPGLDFTTFPRGTQPTSAPAGASCTSPLAPASTPVLCTGPTIAAGETQTYTFTLTAPPDPRDITITAQLGNGQLIPPYTDPDASNNTTTATIHVVRSDLGISSLIAPQTVTVGEHYTYTVKVKNNGPGPVSAPDFLITPPPLDFTTLPRGIQPTSAPAGASCGDGFSPVSSAIHCTGPTIAAGDTQTYTFTLTAPADPRDITITARLGNGQLIPPYSDPDSSNDTTSATIHVVRSDLGITSLITPQTVAVGEHYTYTVKIKNNGPGPVAGPQFAATPPALDFTTMPSGTQPTSAPAGASCGAGLSAVSSSTVCTGPTIAAGDTQTYTFTLTAPQNPADITITARLGNGQLIPFYTDPDSSNNTTTATVHVKPKADLSVLATLTPAAVAPGGQTVLSVDVVNGGPSTSEPAELRIVSSSPDVRLAPSGTCTDQTSGLGAHYLSCQVGRLAPQGQENHTIDVTAPTTAGFSTISAVVFSGNSIDRTASNNTRNVTLAVSSQPQCADGFDDDGDGQIDAADRGCTDPSDGDERQPGSMFTRGSALSSAGDRVVFNNTSDCLLERATAAVVLTWGTSRFQSSATVETACTDDPLVDPLTGTVFDTQTGKATGTYSNGITSTSATLTWKLVDGGSAASSDRVTYAIAGAGGPVLFVPSQAPQPQIPGLVGAPPGRVVAQP